MMYHVHFLHPAWFFALIPWVLLTWFSLRQKPFSHAWLAACDKHLLPHLLHMQTRGPHRRAQCYMLSALLFMILSLTGPSGKQLPTPVYHTTHPRVILLDLSDAILKTDLDPNRLTRAKFKLHDLFQHAKKDQFGLIVYTNEPFVVSPLTDDAQTIDALIHPIDPTIMPVGGMNLKAALLEGARLIHQTGASYGDLLILTGTPPNHAAIEAAQKLASQNIQTSVIPLTQQQAKDRTFDKLTQAGGGQTIPLSNTNADLNRWLRLRTLETNIQKHRNNTLPIWRDDGRWLLIPAFFCLLPAFRRRWLHRIRS